MTALLSARGICFAFGPNVVLRDVDFEIEPNETVAIVGESGTGKSTLIQILAFLRKPTSGLIRIDGELVTTTTVSRRLLQVVLQEAGASLSPRWTVRRTMREAWDVHGVRVSEDVIVDALDRVRLGAEILERRPDELSGGQKQRVAIARALALSPRLLLLDEPFAGLDVSIAAQVHQLLRRLRTEAELTMVIVSHDLAMVRHLADRVAVMAEGAIVEVGPTEALFEAPRAAATRALVSAMPGSR